MIKIYALINPINDSVFYIGASINPEARLGIHIGQRYSSISKKNKAIRNICESGFVPELLILDEVDWNEVRFWEEFYMQLFTSYGYTLQQRKISGYTFTQRGGSEVFTKQINELNGLVIYTLKCKDDDYRQVEANTEHKLNEFSDKEIKMFLSKLCNIEIVSNRINASTC